MKTEQILLVCFLWLSGWAITSCLPHQYHFINTSMTWTEAQSYCRQTYTDLATIENFEEVGHVMNTVSASGYGSDFWVGLYSEIEWKWSDGDTGSGAEYRNWLPPDEPNFSMADEFCVDTGTDGWWDDDCFAENPFFCYNGTQSSPNLVHVNQRMSWHSAQRYCREYFIDLASLKSLSDQKKVKNFFPVGNWAWIGLYRDPQDYWSDGSRSSFRNWVYFKNRLGSQSRACVSMDLRRYGRWMTSSCNMSLPFVCYSAPPTVTQQVVKMRIKRGGSPVDLNEDAVKEDILRKIQERLKENGVSGVNVKWREQSDGKVFHEEKEEKEKKTELCH